MAGYGTDQQFTDWLAENGYELPADAPAVAVLRNRGSAYVDGTYGSRFSGVPTDFLAQDRAWPRTGACAFGASLASDLIPLRVIHASFEAALQEARAPGSLSVVVTGSARVVREKVGDLEVQYANPGADAVLDAQPVLTVIEGLLAPLLTRPMPGIMVV